MLVFKQFLVPIIFGTCMLYLQACTCDCDDPFLGMIIQIDTTSNGYSFHEFDTFTITVINADTSVCIDTVINKSKKFTQSDNCFRADFYDNFITWYVFSEPYYKSPISVELAFNKKSFLFSHFFSEIATTGGFYCSCQKTINQKAQCNGKALELGKYGEFTLNNSYEL